ncbi:MAG TPA: lipopolysaccharide biosynthesis protein [Noviherbaspirillum sp.]|nr:lipopolysaccharide biosynthesis protein [Noviherbaspirillum sp.]
MVSPSDLKQASVSAVKWSAMGTVARYVLQFSAQIVLARLLGPENYGLFAMGMLVMTLSRFVSDLGFCWSLMQNLHIREEDIRFTFTWQLILGSATAAALYLSAPLLAAYFNEPRVEQIVRWLSLASVLSALTAPSTALLSRRLDFRWINIIQVGSYAIGYLAIGVPLAFHGFGVWSLVAAWLGQALFSLVFSILRCPYPTRPLLWYDGAAALWRYGLTVFVTNLCNGLLTNLDRLFLGRFLAARQVGLYTAGYNLADAPNGLLVSALQPVFFAAGARIQNDPQRLRRGYLSLLATVWILIAPMFVVFAFVARDIVAILYGPGWELSGSALMILALGMPAYITCAMSTPVLWNTGRKHFESLLQLPILALAGIAFYSLASHGVIMVAGVAACMQLVRAAVIASAACCQLGIGARDLAHSAARGIVLCLIAAGGTFAGGALFDGTGAAHLAAFIGGALLGGGVLVMVALMFPALLGKTVLEVLGRFSVRLP